MRVWEPDFWWPLDGEKAHSGGIYAGNFHCWRVKLHGNCIISVCSHGSRSHSPMFSTSSYKLIPCSRPSKFLSSPQTQSTSPSSTKGAGHLGTSTSDQSPWLLEAPRRRHLWRHVGPSARRAPWRSVTVRSSGHPWGRPSGSIKREFMRCWNWRWNIFISWYTVFHRGYFITIVHFMIEYVDDLSIFHFRNSNLVLPPGSHLCPMKTPKLPRAPRASPVQQGVQNGSVRCLFWILSGKHVDWWFIKIANRRTCLSTYDIKGMFFVSVSVCAYVMYMWCILMCWYSRNMGNIQQQLAIEKHRLQVKETLTSKALRFGILHLIGCSSHLAQSSRAWELPSCQKDRRRGWLQIGKLFQNVLWSSGGTGRVRSLCVGAVFFLFPKSTQTPRLCCWPIIPGWTRFIKPLAVWTTKKLNWSVQVMVGKTQNHRSTKKRDNMEFRCQKLCWISLLVRVITRKSSGKGLKEWTHLFKRSTRITPRKIDHIPPWPISLGYNPSGLILKETHGFCWKNIWWISCLSTPMGS